MRHLLFACFFLSFLRMHFAKSKQISHPLENWICKRRPHKHVFYRTGGLGNFKAPIHLTDATQCPLQLLPSKGLIWRTHGKLQVVITPGHCAISVHDGIQIQLSHKNDLGTNRILYRILWLLLVPAHNFHTIWNTKNTKHITRITYHIPSTKYNIPNQSVWTFDL